MTWAEDEMSELVAAYFAYWALTYADPPASRAVRNEHWWAVEQVQDAELDGTLPVDVLDALFRAPDGDAAYRSYVAAGPLEVLLEHHPHLYNAAIADRCRVDPLWAEVAGGVWLTSERWRDLPETLQRLIPEPKQQPTKARQKRKRPSKRQR